MSALEVVEERLRAVTHYEGRKGSWRCPAHADGSPSLSVSRGSRTEGVVLKCHAGCSPAAVVGALGLTLADLFDERKLDREIVATYPYVDEAGEVLFEKVRYMPKGFAQRRPDGRGGWVWRLSGTRQVLYRLPAVRAAVAAHGTVWVAEGEKDADALVAAGVCATTVPGGAGKWYPEHAEALAGAGEVVIVADLDDAGRSHARMVYESVVARVDRVTIVEPVVGKDAADHLARGRSLSEFEIVHDSIEHGATLDAVGYVVDVPRELSPPTSEVAALPVVARNLDVGFWSERTILREIHQTARARLISPDALLGAVLVRVSAFTHHAFRLPPIVGRDGTLSAMVALVGPAGAGKGSVMDGSRKLEDPGVLGGHRAGSVVEAPAGSGEGLVAMFFGRPLDPDTGKPGAQVQTAWNALVRVDEVEALNRLAARRDQTTGETLRRAWSGEALGASYADAEKNRHLPAFGYRLAVMLGVQPELSGPLFDEAAAGTPQRITWLSAQHPDVADDGTLEPPGSFTWRCPIPRLDADGAHVMGVPVDVRTALRAEHVARVNGSAEADALDGHGGLRRLKLAGLLALLDSRTDIDADDWRLAGVIEATSSAVRSWCVATVANERARAARTDAVRAGRRRAEELRVEDERAEDRVERAAKMIARKAIAAPEPLTAQQVRDACGKLSAERVTGRALAIERAWIIEADGRFTAGPKASEAAA